MKKLLLLSIVSLFISKYNTTIAQELFTYGKHKATKEEFLKIHNKNTVQGKPLTDESSVRESLNLFALFRMKVAEAKDMKLDTIEQVNNELTTYKNQLAKSYLSDKDVNKKLLDEAYTRLKEEIKVAHILVAVNPNTDSIAALKKIDSIYQQLNSGAKFEQVAQISDDKSSAAQGGNIG